MPLSLDAVLALSPDEASTKAARGLLKPAKWPTLGTQGGAVWGECQGSGATPYQTQVDLGDGSPAFRCTCPSRKFPCKHGLALLMLQAQSPASFTEAPPPAWVAQWLASRTEKAQKKQEQQAQQRERLAAAPPADPSQPSAQDAKRWHRIDAGVAELQRWLADQLRRGLGNPAEPAAWHTLAARLVDAQAPGLAARVREAAEQLGQPERLLPLLGLLQLACDAVSRRASLDPDQQADVRTLVGWPHDRAELLARGPVQHDRWLVLGQISEERDAGLRERRVWLHGLHSGRRALLLDHVHASSRFERHWLNGSAVDCGLVFFPGAAVLRALVATADAIDATNTTATATTATAASTAAVSSPAWPTTDTAAEWQQLAQRLAACPWVPLHPLLFSAARVLYHGPGCWLQLDSGQRLPLALGEEDGWSLLASAGGQPLQLLGEWNGRVLRPLSANHADGRWQRSG